MIPALVARDADPKGGARTAAGISAAGGVASGLGSMIPAFLPQKRGLSDAEMDLAARDADPKGGARTAAGIGYGVPFTIPFLFYRAPR